MGAGGRRVTAGAVADESLHCDHQSCSVVVYFSGGVSYWGGGEKGGAVAGCGVRDACMRVQSATPHAPPSPFCAESLYAKGWPSQLPNSCLNIVRSAPADAKGAAGHPCAAAAADADADAAAAAAADDDDDDDADDDADDDDDDHDDHAAADDDGAAWLRPRRAHLRPWPRPHPPLRMAPMQAPTRRATRRPKRRTRRAAGVLCWAGARPWPGRSWRAWLWGPLGGLCGETLARRAVAHAKRCSVLACFGLREGGGAWRTGRLA